MNVGDVRKKYLEYYKKKGHVEIPSSSLVPENDPTTLFTGSGMQPLITYLLGKKHPKGTRLVNSQKCFRAEDIEEVGDNRHTTFFEMLGNWSLGDYFKKEQIPWVFNFLVQELNIDPNKLYVTVFSGDASKNLSADDESVEIWKELFDTQNISAEFAYIGSEEDGYNRGMKDGERIFAYDASKNWWSRAGVPENMPAGEPGGPDSEIFYDFGTEHDPSFGECCHPNCDCGRFMEIGNSVFMEYIKQGDESFQKLPQQNVDFGGGLERIAAAANDNGDVFTLDVFQNVITKLEDGSGKRYTDPSYTESFRVISDHVRAAVFLIADGVPPGNKDQQYFVRRLIRRSIRHADILEFNKLELHTVVPTIVESYKDVYSSLHHNQERIQNLIATEEEQFRATLEKGMREFEKLAADTISGKDAFVLFTTYGFPYELVEEIATERNISVDRKGFDEEMKKHQDVSRQGAEQKFKGGLADHSEKTTALHTATHLMLAGLRKELGDHVHQKGSNITEERTRFDFNHEEKVDREILDRVEEYVNNAIQSNATVAIEQMDKEEAKASGVEGSFWEKYPDVVNVYTVKDAEGNIYSRELCGGPHVESTKDMGTFKIKKEESSSAGVRRIKAVLE